MGNILLSSVKFVVCYLLKRIINFWEDGKRPSLDAYYFVFAISCLLYVISWLTEMNFFRSTKMGMQTKGLFVTCIYRKMLNLSTIEKVNPGYLINLASNDTQKFEEFCTFMHFIIIGPMELIGTLTFLYLNIGWKATLGAFITMIFVMITQFFISRKTGSSKEKSLVYNDAVAKTFSDVLHGINAIKYYAWEEIFMNKVLKHREGRLKKMLVACSLKGVNESIFFAFPFIICGMTIGILTLSGEKLSTSSLFSSVSLLIYVCLTIAFFAPLAVQFAYEANVAAKRLNDFFLNAKEKDNDKSQMDDERAEGDCVISFSNASFCYGFTQSNHVRATSVGSTDSAMLIENMSSASLTPNVVLSNVNLEIKSGEVCVVVGPVGAGKSSFLLACLKEMSLCHGSMSVNGIMSYAPQNPWIIGGTVMENIVLWREFDKELYDEVLNVSCLINDLRGFPNGDQTFIFDGGSNISGGQKARLSLARAIYDKKANLFLLDDVFSALDNIVGSQLYQNLKRFLEGKTVVLITHQLQFMKGADRIIFIEDGMVKFNGSLSDLQDSEEIDFLKIVQNLNDEDSVETSQLSISATVTEGLDEIFDKEEQESETMVKGKVNMKYYGYFIKNMGNWFYIFCIMFLLVITQVLMTLSDRWLAHWSSLDSSRQSEQIYPTVYAILVSSALILTISRAVVYYQLALRSTQAIFKKMVSKIFYSPLYFFQSNPVGRILNRVTKDQSNVDELLTWVMYDSCQCILLILASVIITGISNPPALAILVLLCPLAWFFKVKYTTASRQVKRLEGVSRSPMYNMVSSSMDGLVVIRTTKIEKIFYDRFIGLANRFTQGNLTFNALSRWFSVRINILTDTFFFFTALLCMIFKDSLTEQDVALALTYVMQLSGLTQWCLRQISEVESQMTCFERIIEYSNLPTEAPRETKIDLPKTWPSEGRVSVNSMNLKYPGRDVAVLANIMCNVKPKEKVAIVGRTGAGKSSFISALFRIVEPYPSGCIKIDDVDMSAVGLKDLRSRLAMIPQDTYVFDDTLRFNLDPTGLHPDSELWDVLKKVHLDDLNLPDKLDTHVSSKGFSLSSGEKQLLCLARAILKKSKILVMDEATANIDPETTSKIQETIDKVFIDSTIFTIAHRISTIIDYDRIILLSSGEIVETGSPWSLLQNDDSYFSRLVNEMGPDMADEMKRRAHYHFNKHARQLTE